MPRTVHLFDPPERFVAGTVGEPGQRTFFLQARAGGRLTSVALEKTQVALLAERIGELLDELGSADEPFVIAAPEDLAPLETPIEEEFRVGALGLGWDPSDERVVVEAHAPAEDDDEVPELGEDSDEGPDVLRVRIDARAARAFAVRAESVVSAGRPPCPFCALPLDPQGHVCPRANGYRR